MGKRREGGEWKVQLGLPLDQEQHDRMTKAIQSAVLQVVADLDLASDLSVRLVGPGGRGGFDSERDDPFDIFGPDIGPIFPEGAVMRMPDFLDSLGSG